jgi:hypothetical protein
MKKRIPDYLLPLLLLLLTTLWSAQSNAQVGTWTKVTNNSPYGSGGLMLLLSDGTVMAKTNAGGGSGNTWVKLTPDSKGSYANGTWTTLAPMANDRLYFAAQVLKDGRVYVAGGEYGAGGALGEVYNPVTNSWTNAPNPSSLLGSGNHFSDALSTLLPDGRVMQGYLGTDQKTGGWCTGYVIYDPSNNTYSSGPSAFGNQNEAAMAKLPDNSVLMVDLGSRNSERFIPSQNKWVRDANVPVDIFNSGSQGSESGTAFLLPDGRAFFVGGPSNTAYYTPSGNTNPGVWTAGPSIPNAQGQTDAPGAMMPNGKILLAVNPVATDADHFIAPTSFYEFDYLSNSFTRINGPSGTQTENYAAFVSNMLVLPDGNVLYCHQGDNRYYLYKPAGSPVAIGKPTISQVICNGTNFTLNGTLFNGISEGSSYGDDWQNATNYPIVRLSNGTSVYYARTFNWNSTGVRTGTAPSSVQFTLPAGIPTNASYSLTVTANGITSDPINFNPSNCTSNGVATVYQHCNYDASGYAVALAVGNYTTAQMTALGIRDNDISSVKVQSGYQVTLYDGDNFTGNSLVITADNSCTVNNNFNDITSSIKVSKINTAPTVTLTSPTQGATFVAPANVTLSANASDADGSVSKVEFYNGSTLIATVTASPYTSTWTGVAAGTYSITAVATDNNGATKTSSAASITVQAPGIATVYQHCNFDPTGYAVNLGVGTYTTQQMVALGIKDNDISSVKVKSGYQVTLYDGDNFTGNSLVITADNSCTVNNNFNDIASSIKVSAIVTNVAPTVSITSPTNGAKYTAPASVTLTANASDSDGTVSKVEFYNGSTLISTVTTSPYTYSWSGVAAGTYSITAKATDNSGAVTTSSAVSITVQPTSVATVYQHCNYDLSGYAVNLAVGSYTTQQMVALGIKDNDISSVKVQSGYQVILYDGDNFTGNSLVITADNSCVVGNNFNDITSSIKVSAITSNAVPTVSLTSPSNGATFTSPANVTLSVNASDSDGSITKVEFYNGSSLIATVTSSPYTYNWTGVAAGTYSITAKATDNLSATKTTGAVSITINSSGGCTTPQYVENGGYVAGSVVQNVSRQFECKPYPYTGWCNGAAWAYAPGTGSYWTDAWIDKGACSPSSFNQPEANVLTVSPNPATSNFRLDFSLAGESTIDVQVYDTYGNVKKSILSVTSGTVIDISSLPAGIYMIKVLYGQEILNQTLIKN